MFSRGVFLQRRLAQFGSFVALEVYVVPGTVCVQKSRRSGDGFGKAPRCPSLVLGIPHNTNPGPESPTPAQAAGPQRPPRQAAAPLPPRGQLRAGWADPPLCPGPGAEHPPPHAEARGHTKRRGGAFPAAPPAAAAPASAPLPGSGPPRGANDGAAGAAASGAAAAPSLPHGDHHQQLLHRQPVGQLQHPRLRQGVPADPARAPHGDRDRE